MGCLFSTGPAQVRMHNDRDDGKATGTIMVRMLNAQRGYSQIGSSSELDRAKERRADQEADEELLPTEAQSKKYLAAKQEQEAFLEEQRETIRRDKELLSAAEQDLQLAERRKELAVKQCQRLKREKASGPVQASAKSTLVRALRALKEAQDSQRRQQMMVDQGSAMINNFERIMQAENMAARAAEWATLVRRTKMTRRFDATEAVDEMHEHTEDAAEVEDELQTIMDAQKLFQEELKERSDDTNENFADEADALINGMLDDADVDTDEDQEAVSNLEELLETPTSALDKLRRAREKPTKQLSDSDEEEPEDRILDGITA